MDKFVDKNELYKHYSAHTLTDYLQTLSLEELKNFSESMYKDDIINEKIDILGAIRNEIEYRKSDEILNARIK